MSKIIILESDYNMGSIRDIMRLSLIADDYSRGCVNEMLDKILEHTACATVDAKELAIWTNWFSSSLPYMGMGELSYGPVVVNSAGIADATDRRDDLRKLHSIVNDLAEDLRQQLHAWKLYDKYGMLYYDLVPARDWSDLSICLTPSC